MFSVYSTGRVEKDGQEIIIQSLAQELVGYSSSGGDVSIDDILQILDRRVLL